MPFEVYVGNYPTTFVEDDVLDLFQVFEGTELKRFHKLKKKCYSILRCADEDQVIEIVKTMHDIDVCGRNLIVRSCDNSLQTRIEESLSTRGVLSLHPRNRCDYSSSYAITGDNLRFIPTEEFTHRPSPLQQLITYKNKFSYNQNKEDLKTFDNSDPDNHTSYQTCVFPNTGSYIVLPDLRQKDIHNVRESNSFPDSISNNPSDPISTNLPDPNSKSLSDPNSNIFFNSDSKSFSGPVSKRFPNSNSKSVIRDSSPRNLLPVFDSKKLHSHSKSIYHIPGSKGHFDSGSKNHQPVPASNSLLSIPGSNGFFPVPSSNGLLPIPGSKGLLPVPSTNGLLPVPSSKSLRPVLSSNGLFPVQDSNGLPNSNSNGLLPMPNSNEHSSNGLLPHPNSKGLLPHPGSKGLLPHPGSKGLLPHPGSNGLLQQLGSNGLFPTPHSNGLLPIPGSKSLLPDPPNRCR
ncbi:uncharacterized protein NPIL_608481 [Nephila pilipes]|uniref:RRM domain-containing protein n=2 Tax=Nephila pilipes TaxID=299642 RepID=A0A8X6MKU6_NEPPI|nr:uncharacterized protein NPIL_608481 [Nephila pilipes]